MDQKISYLRHVNRDTLWHEHFSTDSTLLGWRNSFRPDTAQKVDYTLADITHDSTQGGRLKVVLVANPLADDGAMIAAVGIDHEGLQTGKRYLLSFRADTMHLPENYRTLKIGYFTDSMLAVGLPLPEYLEDIAYSGDTIKVAFTAGASSLRMVLIAESPEAGEGFYYLDDYTLREGWVSHLSCDPGNVANNADAKRYRYGFNGQENDFEINSEGNSLDFGARIYDSRLGRWLSVDPLIKDIPWFSSYIGLDNNPIIYLDPDGKRTFYSAGACHDCDKKGYITKMITTFKSEGIILVDIFAHKSAIEDIAFTVSEYSLKPYYLILSSQMEKEMEEYNERLKLSNNSPANPNFNTPPPTVPTMPKVDTRISITANRIKKELSQEPLKPGEQFNLMGTSAGSVIMAQTALMLANEGYVIDNLILNATSIPIGSELDIALKSNKNIKKVIYEDTDNDDVSGISNKSVLKKITTFIKLAFFDKQPHMKVSEDPNYPKKLAKSLKTKGVK